MTISQVLTFPSSTGPIYIFIPTSCLQSACHLLISCLYIITRLASHISSPQVFLSTVLRAPTLDSGFVDVVLLVLSITISVARHLSLNEQDS